MPSYRVQQVGERDPFYFPVLFVAFLGMAAVFAVWRTTVVNWGVWFGPVAWLTEMFGLVTTVVFVVSLRRSVRPLPPPPAPAAPGGRTVDVLIPTANEPPSVLEPTVIGAVHVRGVRDVLVLDDGARAEVRAMAARLGVRYVPRATREGAKAGNLNHGMLSTDAEFVVTLDADHVPLPELVEEMLGYFEDPQVAFVQSPQSFYNTASFTFRRRRGSGSGWHEQEMFYGGVQPTKNATNSAVYTGTSAMLRRSALDSVGGFATGTPTEDMHTSIRLHARGWRSVYLRTPLAYGLEVENLQEYYRTRRRWAVGSLHLLFRHPDSPLRARGLSVAQRLNYFSSMASHLRGLIRLLYVVTPVAALLTGIPPVEGSYGYYGFAFLAFTVLTIGFVVLFGRGHYHMIHSEIFAVADSVATLSGLRGLFGTEQKFEVTRKQPGAVTGSRLKVAYAVFASASVFGLSLALYRLARGEHVALAAWCGAFLALNTAYFAAFFVTLVRYERRASAPAFARLAPAELYRYVVTLHGTAERHPTRPTRPTNR
jgi:cellulose synthase/poly-beta-1,6-N-acetylglucosamine synthase-like glycosyltransferase